MEPSSYCGAFSYHVICENFLLDIDPIKVFGNDNVNYETTWLDMVRCKGNLNSSAFSLLPQLEILNITDCEIENYSPSVFAHLENLKYLDIRGSKIGPIEKELFEGCKITQSISISDITIASCNAFIYLTELEELEFDNCIFDNVQKDIFAGLGSLKSLRISNCKMRNGDCVNDIFDNLIQLERLDITDSEMENIDLNGIFKLETLKYLALYGNKENPEIDYKTSHSLPILESILFDIDILTILDFDMFPCLKNVTIDIVEKDNPKVATLIETLKTKHINYEYVLCGKIEDEDDDDTQICC